MRVYISGKVTGDPNHRMTFHGAALPLLALGHEVLNPVDETEGMSDEDAMRRGVWMLLTADCIVMLPGWTTSRGAIVEHLLARRLGLPIIYDNREAPACV
jgi:hypothetical protein